MAANHCRNRIKYLARRRRQLTENYDEQLDEGGAQVQERPNPPDRLLEAHQTEHLLQAGLLKLDEEQRELIVLREVEHLSYEEIMEITGLPEGTVKSRLHRARTGPQEYLEKHEGRGVARKRRRQHRRREGCARDEPAGCARAVRARAGWHVGCRTQREFEAALNENDALHDEFIELQVVRRAARDLARKGERAQCGSARRCSRSCGRAVAAVLPR